LMFVWFTAEGAESAEGANREAILVGSWGSVARSDDLGRPDGENPSGALAGDSPCTCLFPMAIL